MTKPILPVTRKMALKKLSDHAFEKATFELIFHRFWYYKTQNHDDGLQFSKRVLREAIDRCFSKKNRRLLYLSKCAVKPRPFRAGDIRRTVANFHSIMSIT